MLQDNDDARSSVSTLLHPRTRVNMNHDFLIVDVRHLLRSVIVSQHLSDTSEAVSIRSRTV